MKFGTTLAMCAASALGTAFALNAVTDGAVKRSIINCIEDDYLLDEDFDDFESEDSLIDAQHVHVENDGIVALTSVDCPEGALHDHVMMPINDAINLYQIIEDSVGQIDPENRDDHACFGDKAISFERLYDAIETDLNKIVQATDEEPAKTDE